MPQNSSYIFGLSPEIGIKRVLHSVVLRLFPTPSHPQMVIVSLAIDGGLGGLRDPLSPTLNGGLKYRYLVSRHILSTCPYLAIESTGQKL